MSFFLFVVALVVGGFLVFVVKLCGVGCFSLEPQTSVCNCGGYGRIQLICMVYIHILNTWIYVVDK